MTVTRRKHAVTLALGGTDVALSVAIQPSGGIIVAGTSFSGGYACVARFNNDGSLDNSFGPSGNGRVTVAATYGYKIKSDSVSALTDGNILLSRATGGNVALFRFTATGHLDTTFGTGEMVSTDVAATDYGYDLTVQPDGKILVTGITAWDGNHMDWALIRYNADGTLDPTFGTGGKLTTFLGASPFAEADMANAVAVLPDGQILVGGIADRNGAADWALVRYSGGDNTSAATGLTASAVSATQVNLLWTLRQSDASSSIDVYRSTDGVHFAMLVGNLPGNYVSYNDTTAAEGTHYYYRLNVTALAGPAGYSNVADTYSLPTAPSGLAITMSSGNAVLTWTNNSSTSPQFYIEQSPDNTNFSIIDETAAGATTYTDAVPSDGTSYYRVDAVNGDGTASNPSGIASVTNAILAPSDLSAQAVSDSEVDLSWANNSSVADGITILRSTNGGAFTALTTLTDPTTNTFADTGLTAGTNYAYGIEATQGSTASAASSAANDTTTPPTPTLSTVIPGTSAPSSELDLTWTAVSGAAGYDIQRQAAGGTAWQDVGQVAGGGSITFTDVGLWDGLTYSYQIDAYNNAGTSSVSNTVTAATDMTAPIAPTVQEVVLSPTSNELVWVNNAYNEESFTIQRSDNGAPMTTLDTVAPNVDKYLDSTVNPAHFYAYLVTAHNSVGENSGAATLYTTPGSSSCATGMGDTISVGTVQDAAEHGPDGQPSRGFFAITRTGDLSGSLTVPYSVGTGGNAATPDNEYQALSSPVSFDPGQSTVLVPVTPNEINHVEGNTTVTIFADSGSGYPVSATVNIVNTDRNTITVPSGTLDLGIPNDVWISVLDFRGRPFAGSLTLSTDDTAHVSFGSSTIVCGADGVADAQITSKETSESPTITVTDSRGNTCDKTTPVAAASPWTKIQTSWTMEVAAAKSGEGCTLGGLALLITGNKGDWTALKERNSKRLTKVNWDSADAVIPPDTTVGVLGLLQLYDSRLRDNVIAAKSAFNAKEFGTPNPPAALADYIDYVNKFFQPDCTEKSDCQNAVIVVLQKALMQTLTSDDITALDLQPKPAGGLDSGGGFGLYITSPTEYQRGDWTWDINAEGVPAPWNQENLICLDEKKAADGTTKYWGYEGTVKTGKTGDAEFWDGVLKDNQPGQIRKNPVGPSNKYKFWNVPILCQKLFHVRGGTTA